MEMVIVRHGQFEMNGQTSEKEMYCGRYNGTLSQMGKHNAILLQSDENVKRIQKVYTSDLERAIQTAMLAKPGYEIEIRKEITERSLGVFEGHIVEEIKEKYPEYFKNKELMNFRFDKIAKAPKGENYTQVCDRAIQFLNTLDLKQDITIGIFSHMYFIRCFLYLVLGLPEKEVYHLKIKHCKPIVVIGEEVGKFRLLEPTLEELY